MTTLPPSEQMDLFGLMSLSEVSPVKTYQWLDAARDWMESGVDCGLSSIALLQAFNRDGLSLKMSPAFYPPMTDETLPSSFEGWSNAGMASPGGFWMLNSSEYPNAAAVCSLSEVLETDVPSRYFLSATACQGILRRAEKRGRELPEALRMALSQVATDTTPTERNILSPAAMMTTDASE